MRVSAKADYAVRAALELAAARVTGDTAPVKGERIASGQNILVDLRRPGS